MKRSIFTIVTLILALASVGCRNETAASDPKESIDGTLEVTPNQPFIEGFSSGAVTIDLEPNTSSITLRQNDRTAHIVLLDAPALVDGAVTTAEVNGRTYRLHFSSNDTLISEEIRQNNDSACIGEKIVVTKVKTYSRDSRLEFRSSETASLSIAVIEGTSLVEVLSNQLNACPY